MKIIFKNKKNILNAVNLVFFFFGCSNLLAAYDLRRLTKAAEGIVVDLSSEADQNLHVVFVDKGNKKNQSENILREYWGNNFLESDSEIKRNKFEIKIVGDSQKAYREFKKLVRYRELDSIEAHKEIINNNWYWRNLEHELKDFKNFELYVLGEQDLLENFKNMDYVLKAEDPEENMLLIGCSIVWT